jgi:hypothetical protein
MAPDAAERLDKVAADLAKLKPAPESRATVSSAISEVKSVAALIRKSKQKAADSTPRGAFGQAAGTTGTGGAEGAPPDLRKE